MGFVHVNRHGNEAFPALMACDAISVDVDNAVVTMATGIASHHVTGQG